MGGTKHLLAHTGFVQPLRVLSAWAALSQAHCTSSNITAATPPPLRERPQARAWCACTRCSSSAIRVRSAASAGRSTGLPSSLGSRARSAGSIWCSSTHCLRRVSGPSLSTARSPAAAVWYATAPGLTSSALTRVSADRVSSQKRVLLQHALQHYSTAARVGCRLYESGSDRNARCSMHTLGSQLPTLPHNTR
jgi:hypothetical protein